ncbi:hypothetical protein RclHR1_33410001 [Rhizophagus clarus]|uniref:Uncharacterized protein n=1 Tax=Rhizophagus clarus TaxID=94130 RepID=A0A2Z6R9X0_9GLOM|nr:hypothetical protein RclHR1_33410001 [Rhizophagus clarus]GET00207.1 hypothetical protein GLOIN_2v1654767 [Rhizophagus clarus]
MNQSLYYVVTQINQDIDMHKERTLEVTIKQISDDISKITLNQIIEFVRSHNVKEIWAINVENLLDTKHYVLLLQNQGYLCSCLLIIQCGIIYKHYFQENITYNYDEVSDANTSLYLFNQNNNGFCEDQLTILEQKLIYNKLHEMYKKILNKALQSNSKSE